MHRSDGNARAEAQVGSKEQRILLDFLEKHGSERLMKPGYRAELLGDRHHRPTSTAHKFQHTTRAETSRAAKRGGF